MREVIGQEHSNCSECDTDTWHMAIVKTRKGWAHRSCAEARVA